MGHRSCGQRGPMGDSEEHTDVSTKERVHFQHMSGPENGKPECHFTTQPPNKSHSMHSLDLSPLITCDPDEKMRRAEEVRKR